LDRSQSNRPQPGAVSAHPSAARVVRVPGHGRNVTCNEVTPATTSGRTRGRLAHAGIVAVFDCQRAPQDGGPPGHRSHCARGEARSGEALRSRVGASRPRSAMSTDSDRRTSRNQTSPVFRAVGSPSTARLWFRRRPGREMVLTFETRPGRHGGNSQICQAVDGFTRWPFSLGRQHALRRTERRWLQTARAGRGVRSHTLTADQDG